MAAMLVCRWMKLSFTTHGLITDQSREKEPIKDKEAVKQVHASLPTCECSIMEK